MSSLEELDRFIGGIVRRWAARISGGAQPAELLEIRRDILNDISSRIVRRGGGQTVFPFQQIELRIAAGSANPRELLEAAFVDGASLEHDIRELLCDAGAPVKDLTVNITIDEGGAGPPFRAEYVRTKGLQKAVPAPARPPARLMVLSGRADPPQLSIERNRINIGRLKEVVSESEGVRRRNDVAFAEEETTVSREHAEIVYDQQSGRFRLIDTSSQRGTSIFREGRRIDASRRGRGVQLQSGDEIHLGNARLRFEIG